MLAVVDGEQILIIALWVAGFYGVMSAVAFCAYGIDKHQAARGKWRVPEWKLHLIELLGGWPGALAGQRAFRHKRRKVSFMLMFAGIVLLHAIAWMAWLLR